MSDMTNSLVLKLEALILAGVRSEADAAYLLVCIRKLMEQQETRDQYPSLSFHCDWALHSKLDRGAAQRILQQFDTANIHLREGGGLGNLPSQRKREIERTYRMEGFEEELARYLAANNLPALGRDYADGWTRFLHFYVKVVEGSQLVISDKNRRSSTVEKVTIKLELATLPEDENEILFKVTWTIWDTNGRSGDIFVINSFTLPENM